MQKIRNIAIIAHVDHGKTTLVDQLLKQSGTFRANQKVDERVMDSMDLEKEKGITIRAKNAAFRWNGYHINIVDTPGHADFGGEVERIMKMVMASLVVDAHDGPQAQTKFVLRKAMENGLPVVVINKIDRENARPHKVLDMVFELFLELNATDEQLDFPHIYASAKQGFAKRELVDPSQTMLPLYEAIAWHIPAPQKSDADYFQFLVSNLDYSDYLGRIAYGRIVSGSVKVGQNAVCFHNTGKKTRANVTAIFSHEGLEKIQVDSAPRATLLALPGSRTSLSATITDNEEREALPSCILIRPRSR
jgi:GTP-binding protein